MSELEHIGLRMRDFLEMAVRTEIATIVNSGLEITDWHIEEAQRRMAAPRLSGAGEEFMFRINGDTQRSMKDLIEALAIMACVVPDGVTFYGLHFRVNHAKPMECVERR